MRTEVTYIYKHKRIHSYINALNPSSAIAQLFIQKPQIRGNCTIINCIATSRIRPSQTGTFSENLPHSVR